MEVTYTNITEESAFEISIRSRSVEMHSRMQQLKEHDKKNIENYLASTLKSVSHYILLNTIKPG